VSENESSSGWLVDAGSDPDDIAERYDEWAEAYDRDLETWDYRAPETVAGLVSSLHPTASTILDAGCGTGLVGRALRRSGFSGVIDGLDVSSSSVELAAASGVYRTLRTADLQQPLDVPDDAFDVLVCVGVMTYLPGVETVWREFARVVVPGGILIVTQREDLWEPRGCQGAVDRLTRDEVWSDAQVTGPEPYLPDNTEGMAPIGVYYLTARVA